MNPSNICVHKGSESAEIGNTPENLEAWAAIGFLPRSAIPSTANAKPLRTDGPTLAEYVAAGYPAGNYPPEGYAVNPGSAPADAKPEVPVSNPKGPAPSPDAKQADAGSAPADAKPEGNAKSKG